jgi:hypothetical protein
MPLKSHFLGEYIYNIFYKYKFIRKKAKSGEFEYDTYGEHLKVLTDAEEQKFYDYVSSLAEIGFGLDRKRADLKLKQILNARGAVWDTEDGKCDLHLAFPGLSYFLPFFISPSNGWWDGFFHRFPDVSFKIAKKVDRIHAFAAKPDDANAFYDILEGLYEYEMLSVFFPRRFLIYYIAGNTRFSSNTPS